MTTLSEHRLDTLSALSSFRRLLGRAPRDCYADLALWTIIERILSDRKIPQVRHDQWHAISQARHAQAAYARDGMPGFRLTHGLAAALLLTETRLPISDLRFPFGSFVIELPGPDSPLVLSGGRPERTNVLRMWVHHTEMIVRQDEVQRLSDATAPFVDRLIKASDLDVAGAVLRELEPFLAREVAKLNSERVINVLAEMAEGSPMMLSASIPRLAAPGAADEAKGEGLDTHEVMAAPLAEGVIIEDWLQALNKKTNTRPGIAGTGYGGEREDDIAAVIRLVVNLCLYVTRRDKATGESTVGAGRPVRASPVRPAGGGAGVEPRVWLVGEEVKLPAHVREMVRRVAAEGKQRQPWHISKRFIVRGHWRNQACGPGRANRRPKWIEPFWKGPKDVSVALIRQYMADTGEEGGN